MLGDFFDPKREFAIHEHCRPHWSQGGSVVFITFRTHDSIPRDVVKRWDLEKYQWLRKHSDVFRSAKERETKTHWTALIERLSQKDRDEFNKTFERTRETFLDSCHGRCLLKRPELARIVSDTLLHFDRQRYFMGDFVIMPNHVHLLAAFPTATAMKEQCDSWLHYSSFQINKLIDEKGKFWQQEPFDHLVRNGDQYEYLRNYIHDNPQKANLKSGQYFYRRLA